MAEFCRGISKFFLAIIGGLFCIVAALFFAMGGLIIAGTKHLHTFEGAGAIATTTAAIVLACGFFWFLAGLAGCCTVCSKESKALPCCFGILLMIIITFMVGSSVLVMVSKNKFESGLKEGMYKEMYKFTGVANGTETGADDKFFANMQESFKCCGVVNASDWLNTTLAPKWQERVENKTDMVPISCCDKCHNTTDYSIDVSEAYQSGCEPKIVNWIHHNTWWIAGIVIFLTVLLVIGFIGTCVLLCSNRSLPYSDLGYGDYSS